MNKERIALCLSLAVNIFLVAFILGRLSVLAMPPPPLMGQGYQMLPHAGMPLPKPMLPPVGGEAHPPLPEGHGPH